MRDACKGYEGCMRARQRGSGSHRLNVRRDVACVHTAAWRGWRGRDFRHRLPSWCAAAAWRGRRARLELVLWERAARLFGCYVAQSRKSAWGHVSLFWYAGATAPLKRMAPFQWATVRVHMTGRLHVSFGCALSIPVQQDAIQQLEDAIEHNLVLAAARVARVRRSNLQAVENHKRAVQMLLKRCSFCTQRRSHGGTALLRVRGPLRRRATIGGRDASQVRLAGGAGRVR